MPGEEKSSPVSGVFTSPHAPEPEHHLSGRRVVPGRRPGDAVDLPLADAWRQAFDALPDLLAVLDARHRVVQVNRAMAQRLGRSKPQCIGPTWCRLVHGGHEPSTPCPYAAMLEQGEGCTQEIHEPRLGGDVLCIAAPLRSAEGERVGSVLVVRDIRERKLAEEVLRQSGERFHILFENAAVGVALVDQEGRVVEANHTLCQFLGYAHAEVTGMRFADLTYPEDVEADAALLESFLQGQSRSYDTEKRYVCRDGAVVWGRMVGAPVHDRQGGPAHAMVVCVDITRRKRAEEARRESEKRQAEAERLAATGRMAARVAHEINNPLAGIQNAFHLIRDAVPRNHPDHDMVERIDREIGRIAHIVREMYTLYSPRAEKVVPVAVADVVRDVLLMLESLRCERDIRFHVRHMDPDLVIPVREGGLHQVFYNLLTNALEASPRGGRVTLAAEVAPSRAGGGLVEITVRDQGVGIPAEIQKRVFEPFFTSKAEDGAGKSLGVGLSVVKTIVESSGGQIDFESLPGQGTVFRVAFPVYCKGQKE